MQRGRASEREARLHSRKRVIYAVGKGLIDSAGLVDVSGQDAQAVAELIADEVLVEIHRIGFDSGMICLRTGRSPASYRMILA